MRQDVSVFNRSRYLIIGLGVELYRLKVSHYFWNAGETTAVSSLGWLAIESKLLIEFKGKPVEAGAKDRMGHLSIAAQELYKASSGRIELTGNFAIAVDPTVANFVPLVFWMLQSELVPSLHR